MNCQILFTAKEMSGLVRERYCKPSTMLRYRVGSSRSGESNFDNLRETAIDEEIGFAWSI